MTLELRTNVPDPQPVECIDVTTGKVFPPPIDVIAFEKNVIKGYEAMVTDIEMLKFAIQTLTTQNYELYQQIQHIKFIFQNMYKDAEQKAHSFPYTAMDNNAGQGGPWLPPMEEIKKFGREMRKALNLPETGSMEKVEPT